MPESSPPMFGVEKFQSQEEKWEREIEAEPNQPTELGAGKEVSNNRSQRQHRLNSGYQACGAQMRKEGGVEGGGRKKGAVSEDVRNCPLGPLLTGLCLHVL